jgi:hypothetical protein
MVSGVLPADWGRKGFPALAGGAAGIQKVNPVGAK